MKGIAGSKSKTHHKNFYLQCPSFFDINFLTSKSLDFEICFKMRSPFSKFSARSRMSLMMDSWSLRKTSQSDRSDFHHDQNEHAALDHCPDCTADKIAKTDALMEKLYTYLDQDHPHSPLYHSPFKIKNEDVARWADSVSPFVMSPATPLSPEDKGRGNAPRAPTPSSAGSPFAGSSGYEESRGPKTPTCSQNVDLSVPRDLTIADVGLAAKPLTTHATNEAVPQIIHKAFSFELVPEAPFRPAPPPPDQITRGELASPCLKESSNTPPPPGPLGGQGNVCQATITSLIDDFMPEYIPSPQITPAENSFPLLKIDTTGFHTPIKQQCQPEIPNIELSPPALPTLHIGEMMSLGYKAYSESRAEQDRRLLSFSDRDVSSSRHSIANLPPQKSTNLSYDEYRKGATRYSVQAVPSKRLINDPQEQSVIHKQTVPANYNAYSPPRTVGLRSKPEIELHIPQAQRTQQVQNILRVQNPDPVPAPIKYVPYSAASPKAHPKRTRAEIESIPPSDSSSKYEEPVAFATNRGIFFTGGFFAREQGLELKMTRMVTTFSKMEWLIQDLAGTRRLKCFAQTNSLSRRKDFWDTEGNLLFSFQKKIGSTRVAETSCGKEVFEVKNASLPSMPHWTIKLASGGKAESSASWIAKGDEEMENVVVRWGGFEVGRIRCESRARKHTVSFFVFPKRILY